MAGIAPPTTIPPADSESLSRKFGKQIQKRQLEVPEYAASFVNYKALKKLIKKLSATPILASLNEVQRASGVVDPQAALQANKVTFFFQLERELEKVNAFYLQKEAELKIRLKTLLDKKKVLQSRSQCTSRRSAKFTTLEEGFQQFGNDLNKLQQFVEINGTAFSKILKKWDKTSKSKTKELYLSRAVEVQPFFNATVICELSDQATTSLQELGAWSEGDNVSFDRQEHVVSSQHLLGTDEGDADSLLLETVISGNVEPLKDLLFRWKIASDPAGPKDVVLMERITRTFLAAISEAPEASLQTLLDTGLVDVQSENDINERNCLHQSAIYGNAFILHVGLSSGVYVSRTDVYGRVPLHYACMHGRLDMIDALLQADQSTIDLIDHDNFTPLIHAIIHGHYECIAMLLAQEARIDALKDNDHVPLNLACEYSSIEIVELLLKHGAKIISDAEGLYPQHLVARSGQTPELLLLLQNHGADLDQVDKLYAWTPLFHTASEGNVPCMQELLKMGVRTDIVDEKNLSAMYYAAWEGHLECMRLLSSTSAKTTKGYALKAAPSSFNPLSQTTSAVPMSIDADGIPDLSLPPPIIPLRRYGHNFLDTKIFVQISFDDVGEKSMIFFHDSKYPASRLTISSKLSDLIPKNIMLPFQEDTRLVSFQIDNLDSFAIDFDIFPTYGAKVIAKTVALPSTFRTVLSSSGRCSLPLFDPRLRAIGQISFNFQVIKPYTGKPLEITDFETYWKATSHLDHTPNAFITGSSLSGEYIQLFVQHTIDGVPVLWPRWTIEYMDIEFLVSRLTYQQFISAGSRLANKTDLSALSKLSLECVADIHYILGNSPISLEYALQLLPRGMRVDLQVLYPSAEEEKTLRLGPTLNINTFIDGILSVVFDHARQLRETSPNSMHSIVFSSYNPTICTALNWKQPNFPVFLCNDLGREEADNIPPAVKSSGRQTTSIKEAVRIAQSNNFMGLICCSRLLDLVPALIESIKSQGLVLVTDKSAEQSVTTDIFGDSLSRLPEGIDGSLRANGVLKFNSTIDM